MWEKSDGPTWKAWEPDYESIVAYAIRPIPLPTGSRIPYEMANRAEGTPVRVYVTLDERNAANYQDFLVDWWDIFVSYGEVIADHERQVYMDDRVKVLWGTGGIVIPLPPCPWRSDRIEIVIPIVSEKVRASRWLLRAPMPEDKAQLFYGILRLKGQDRMAAAAAWRLAVNSGGVL